MPKSLVPKSALPVGHTEQHNVSGAADEHGHNVQGYVGIGMEKMSLPVRLFTLLCSLKLEANPK